MAHSVGQVILILSGKGGVGKSTVCSQLALSLASKGKRVGLLDIDLCGPSIPVLFGLQQAKVTQGQNGWVPVPCPFSPNLLVMSIGFLLSSPDSAVIWRGPKKNALITQFVRDVDWGPIDVLLIDTPPGTSDEHISVVEVLKTVRPADGAILVSTPQALSVGDVRREIAFCEKANIPIRGLIENMSGYVCPQCSECTNVFSKGGAESLARLKNIPFLGHIPIDPEMGELSDQGKQSFESPAAQTLSRIADSLLESDNLIVQRTGD